MKFTPSYDKKIAADYEIVFFAGKKLEGLKDKDVLEFCGFKEGGCVDLPEARRLYIWLRLPDKKAAAGGGRLEAAKAAGAAAEAFRLGAADAGKRIAGKAGTPGKAANGVRKVAVRFGGPVAPAELLPEGCCPGKVLTAIAEGFVLGTYSFDRYKSGSKKQEIKEVIIGNEFLVHPIEKGEKAPRAVPEKKAKEMLARGSIIAGATNYTRDIVNEIPQIYTPARMAKDAEKLAKDLVGVTCKVFGKSYLAKENMNLFLAVNQAGPHEPKLVHLTYKPAGKAKKKIAFVGKGLTYDTGGLSLKSGTGMYTMKSDKGGAAAVMGIIKAAAELKLPYEIHGVLGCTENAIGCGAYKPDDVIKSREGVTVEITNTDAEGRLVLSDCISWTQDHVKPDLMLDLATLTGACVVGLGEYTSGVIGNNLDLQMEFKESAGKSGENYTALEFNRELAKIIDSKVADVRNSAPGTMGGAITAGIFLDKFVREEYKNRWLHLDIAGPAYTRSEWGYNPTGATGAGVRGCIYYMLGL